MNENQLQVFTLFNKSAAVLSSSSSSSLSGSITNSQAHLKPVNSSLATIAKFDKSVFTPGRVEICAFYNNLFNILNYESDEPNWPAIIVLQEAAKNNEARHVLVHTYKFLPSLTRYLTKLKNTDQIMQLLLLIEELTYDIKLNWQESYLISLLNLLSKWIMQNPGTDSVGPYLQSLSLTILVNLCSKNIIVVNLLFKTVNIKDLVKRLMGLRDNEIFSIGICRLFVALQDVQGFLNVNDVHSFLTTTLKIFIKYLKNGDDRALKQSTIFIEDVSSDTKTKSYMLSYDKFDDAIHEILKLSPMIISYTNKNEMGQKINTTLMYTLILLLKILQIELYSMRKFYPLVAEGNRVSNEEETRIIIVNHVLEEDKDKTNEVKTSKYTLLTFFPKNLVEQFRRIANFYFLIVSVIAILVDGPVSPWTSVLPLIFVISITMIKQGYEDWLRHRTDHAVNNEPVTVIRNLIAQEVQCREIRPGELVKVKKDCDVPCDMVLLWSSDSRGKCFVTTANLDGETSLKPLKVPKPLLNTTFDKTFQDKIKMEILKPEPDIYTFFGRMDVGENMNTPIGTTNLLLRGSRIKNTEWAIGCAIYTGKDTKLVMNSKITSNKFTSSESNINNFLLFFLILMIVEVVGSYILKRYFEAKRETEDYIGEPNNKITFLSFMRDLLSFLLLYNYLIPISLYVTIELQKFIGSMFLEWDNDLRCPETNQKTVPNSSDLNEELGQIEILFSDKTGTLTKNDMHFKMCSVNGELYIEQYHRLYEMTDDWLRGETSQAIDAMNPDLTFFFTILALCHTVQVEENPKMSSNGVMKMSRLSQLLDNNNKDSEMPVYQSTSCDEIAFVKAAARRGIIFYGEEGNELVIRLPDGQTVVYEKLQVLEFTSARKMMSIIVRDGNGKIWMFCKGAETSILPLCNQNNLIEKINEHIRFFALQGLRTLAVAYKELTEDEFQKMNKEISSVNLDIQKRASTQGVNRWIKFENGLTLLGATAVEDLLQDGVADTLISLRQADIKIWVLTGDKVETAVNVAQSCGHIPNNSTKVQLVDISTSNSLMEQLAICNNTINIKADRKQLTLIVDGQSLALILGRKHLEVQFAEMSLKCEAVICCRLSPLQKAQIVTIIKKSRKKPVTAAIGDGANDISMIQAAHVGFGLFGKEGRQAARSADFAFAKFMMVKKILLVHGHWYYQRLATLVQYFFYKNFVFVNLMIYFQCYSSFSSQTIFYTVLLTCYNLCYTALPIFVLSLTDQCHSKELLMAEPSLYARQIKNRLLSWKNFVGWLLLAFYHSLIIFYGWEILFFRNSTIFSNGLDSGLWTFGSALGHSLVIGVNFKMFFMARYQTIIFIASIIFSMAFYMAMEVFFSEVNVKTDGDVYGVYTQLLGAGSFWFTSILILVTMFLTDYTYFNFKGLFLKKRIRTPSQMEMAEITHL